jgi:uncharacterized protein with PIN domain
VLEVSTCEMKWWCVLGMKPLQFVYIQSTRAMMSHRAAARFGRDATHNGFHNDCFTLNGALVIV